MLEPEELFAQCVLVLFLRCLDRAAHLILFEVRFFPLVDFGYVVIDGSQGFLFTNGHNPGLHRVLVGGLQRVEFGCSLLISTSP